MACLFPRVLAFEEESLRRPGGRGPALSLPTYRAYTLRWLARYGSWIEYQYIISTEEGGELGIVSGQLVRGVPHEPQNVNSKRWGLPHHQANISPPCMSGGVHQIMQS